MRIESDIPARGTFSPRISAKAIRRILLVFVFAAIFLASLLGAQALTNPQAKFPVEFCGLAIVLKIVTFYFMGNLFGWWSYVTFSDFAAICKASIVASALLWGCSRLLETFQDTYVSTLFVDFLISTLLLCVLRSSFRYFEEQMKVDHSHQTRTLFIGGDSSVMAIANRIHWDRNTRYCVVGILDERQKTWGTTVGGIRVLGGLNDLCWIAKKLEVTDVLVMAGQLNGMEMRDLVERTKSLQLKINVLPTFDKMLNGSVRMVTRDVDINDLLRREPVQLDSDGIKGLLGDKAVIVTGAGGSIGSEICRQILNYSPANLILVEQAENSLFNIERELRAQFPCATITAYIADVADSTRMMMIFDRTRPSVVFHAAAHKHVPMMENNISEAIKNNSLATKQLADLAHRFEVDCFVFISTDKAVHPTSVMGASKHLAERYVHARSQQSNTRFISVRFGNVLGSAGSVVPIFKEQIQAGGPITITDPEMTRFFMTIPEASQLVLQAGAMGVGGEIFVLEMGEPILIVELAQDLIRLSGLTSDAIEIVYTGMRPGEKLHEQLYFDDEKSIPTKHPKVRAAKHRPHSFESVHADFADLAEMADAPDEKLREMLESLIPEFCRMDGDESKAVTMDVLDLDSSKTN